jgi:Protein of unknown function (DUF2721)
MAMLPRPLLAPDLTILAAMITPVVLVSACGTLLLSTATRLSRVTDRVETWSDELATAAGQGLETPIARDRRALIRAQLGMMTWRAHLLQWALTVLYVAVGVFVADMVAIAVAAVTGLGGSWLPIVVALLGAVLLFAGSVLLIAEARHALAMTDRELTFVRHHAGVPDAPAPAAARGSSNPAGPSPGA